MEEQFIDIEHGQAHRAKLMSDLAYGEEQTAPSLRRHHADDGGRARGGGRGGRGGGFAGSRSRAIGLRRCVAALMVSVIPLICSLGLQLEFLPLCGTLARQLRPRSRHMKKEIIRVELEA